MSERDSLEEARPATVSTTGPGRGTGTPKIEGELERGYVLLRPLPVHVWKEADEFVAEQEDFRVHAFGATRPQAIANLKAALVDHLTELIEMGERLSPQLKRDRDRLMTLIRRDA